MNKTILSLLVIFSIISCKNTTETKEVQKTQESPVITEVASFTGQQVTGVTVSNEGRIFANFPRWRKGVENSVVEVLENNESAAFPNEQWNTWEDGKEVNDSLFVAVQSVVAFNNDLYVVDTRNPLFGGVIDNPKIFVFDLTTNSLKRTYTITESSIHKDSYINDVRIDAKNNKAYFTDSGHAGLVILDLESGESKRVLNEHTSTLAEVSQLTFPDGSTWENTVHSDGIALDVNNDILYYHALSGYSLYAIPTAVLNNGTQEEIENSVSLVKKTSAPDGMILDDASNLYFADLENNKVMKMDTNTKEVSTLIEGDQVRWADTFSIYKGDLYYTNSRINEITGPLGDMKFTINKVSID